MRRSSLLLALASLVLMGNVPSSATARNLAEMTPASLLFRALAGDASGRNTPPPLAVDAIEATDFLPEHTPTAEDLAEPMAADFDVAPDEAPAAATDFVYDDNLDLDQAMPFDRQQEWSAEFESVAAEPTPTAAPWPAGPLSTLPASPDPFFGGVHKLLAASPQQTLFPPHTIRPPHAPRMVDGRSVTVDAFGSPCDVDNLPAIANADLVTFTSTRAAASSPGRMVLLVDNRALLLEITDWQDGAVRAQLPAMALPRPTVARLYASNADGQVFDAVDFLLMPPEAE